jgi:hypothetical protein
MHDISFDEQREVLRQTLEHDAEELREAFHGLTDTARVRFDLAERIKESPLVWLLGGFLFGLWLGDRSRRSAVPWNEGTRTQ